MTHDQQESQPSSSSLANDLLSQIDDDGIRQIIHVQKETLSRFEKTNEMLINCHQLCQSRYADVKKEVNHTSMMVIDMKRDLDTIFKRIRNLKNIIADRYPEEYKAAEAKYAKGETMHEEE